MTQASLSLETIHEIRDHCLCLASQRAARRLGRRFDRLFAPLGLTNGQFSLMVALSGSWAPRLGQLAEFLAMDPTTLTAAIKPLEKRGLLALLPDPEDARARLPRLTDAGRAAVATAALLWKQEHGHLATELAGQGGDAPGLARQMAQLR
jgi:DNA-binding MarR family transcriptional regulator